jgi:hypothetical protein
MTIAEIVAAVKAHALEHYETDGWDFVVECWSDDEIANEIVAAPTPRLAIKRIGDIVRILDERRREIQNA